MNKWRRTITICTVVAFLGGCASLLTPVNMKLLNLAFLFAFGGAWVGTLVLTWPMKRVRFSLLALLLVLLLPFMLPGRTIDARTVREAYLIRMNGFEGTTYYWGGENSFGIDCSGLPRRAIRDALFWYGVRNANGRACRMYLEHWWFDASAKALGEGYRDYTIPLGISGVIEEMEYAGLEPGDLAVTESGVHVLAYAGGGKWIQADPGFDSVITLDGRNDYNGWFDVPVTIHRWNVLTEE